ncbi:MAG TPA: excisionase family DNA-binding protein [Armatimonadota bacterium]|nr:excisionase family DNA-binding protein [Armatimonadota bacterium]HOQ27581.1 excisionase family DNA-binding protein [Armatimonadota bacterium]HPO74903.1 excisionase family DNA-binding protein [Armatimonadota bacterium]HPT99481.1 excisionase family DNA-binding protein [Armatimonadota bacterium]
MEQRLLRASEVAPQLGLTTGRVYQLISEGVIPAVRIGGRVRIPEAAWEKWLSDSLGQQRSRHQGAGGENPRD